jgi:hypothetical protein
MVARDYAWMLGLAALRLAGERRKHTHINAIAIMAAPTMPSGARPVSASIR